MHKKTKTWVVVADGAGARILEGDGAGFTLGSDLNLIEELAPPEGRAHNRDLGTDRPGRTQMASGNRHAVDPRSSPRELAEEAFMRRIAERLDEAIHARSFDRLFVVAPPRALGSLRKALSADVLAKVEMELDKDLTHLSAGEIKEHVEGAMG